MRKTIVRIAKASVAVGVALGAAIITSSPAQAASGWTYAYSYAPDGNSVAAAWFESYGEHVYLYDDRADGKGVAFELQRRNSSGTWYTYASGYSNLGSGNGYKFYDFEIPEGAPIRIRACLQNGSSAPRASCGSWQNGTA